MKETSQSNGAYFYDYDVTDGNVYKTNKYALDNTYDRGGAPTHTNGNVWYMYTNRQGINGNFKKQTLGFGNSEGLLKTTMGEIVGNRANAQNAEYGSSTFGLVTGLKDGKIQYASDVKAPNLFNEGDAQGKSSYTGNLTFRQEGDTFTLTGAEVMEKGKIVSQKQDIDKFIKRPNWNNTRFFAANDFYPMDTVSSAGKVDLKFGSPDSTKVIKNFSGAEDSDVLPMPESDDKKDHNHYFGMHYTIGFDLVKDYVGPLEYLFYGDDDMWVFLSGGEYNGKLICDLGGVHSSIGEYINLWDYIDKGTEGHYELSFFYTERGASGSTCWMQFTLPSVSFATTEQDTGELRIEKKITGIPNADQEFGFEVNFTDQNGNNLMNDYSYTKYKTDTNQVVENDILIWNNAKFTLKADEYIVVKFLPENSRYILKEIGPVNIEQGKEPGIDLEWTESADNPYKPEIEGNGEIDESEGEITGTIQKDSTIQVTYNNVQKFELPETGGSGADLYTIVGILCIIGGTYLAYRKKILAKRV